MGAIFGVIPGFEAILEVEMVRKAAFSAWEALVRAFRNQTVETSVDRDSRRNW